MLETPEKIRGLQSMTRREETISEGQAGERVQILSSL